MSASAYASAAFDYLAQLQGQTGWFGLSAYSVKSKKDLKRAKQLQSWQARYLPSLQRQGLESAGYNPLLAVGSASPSVGGTVTSSVPSDGGSKVGLLDAVNTAADIRLKGAQTESTLAHAYVPVRYSRSEAAHFGVSLLAKLGINLGSNNAESFTLLYNPITKDLVNPVTMYSVNTDHAGSAEDVKDNAHVDVQIDAWKPKGESEWRDVKEKKLMQKLGGLHL